MQNSKLILENEELKEKWNNRFNDQQSRVESIIEIAKCERRNIYNDIISLINDQDRFSLDGLLGYSTSEWLAKQNPVILFIHKKNLNKVKIYNDNNCDMDRSYFLAICYIYICMSNCC